MIKETMNEIKNMIDSLNSKTHDQAEKFSQDWQSYKSKTKEYFSRWSDRRQAEIEKLQHQTEEAYEQMKQAKDHKKEQLRLKVVKNLEQLLEYLKKDNED
ncbi:MAG: hypothetical protein CMM87_00465 [Rickettsiales bacterium]|nr:hypothetical protein [Rickettsiales bacterium]|tara:strand:- start:91867 stop:92166 length:300 start_codon:yes stop_codon:yes gene_type:complete